MAIAACLFLVVVGLKWRFVDRYGTDMPDWDQWDAEGLHLYVPWFSDAHFLSELFSPHNEHRIVLSKLQNLAVTLIGGHWDARVETVSNAVLHALVALGLYWLGRRWLEEQSGRMPARGNLLLRGVWFLAVAACFGLSMAWQNILGGFHNQQYWLVGLSFVALVHLPFTHPREWKWWVGALAGSAALLSMASGFFAAAIVLVVVGARLIRRGTTLRESWPTLLLCLALCAIGWFTRHEVDYHKPLRAQSVNEFFLYTRKSLQWPVFATPYAALLFWLPWLGAIWRAWREPAARVPAILAGAGGWVLLQILATAYARGAGADWPSSRYMDTLLFGLAVNGLAMLWLVARIEKGATWTRAAGVAFVALWAFAIAHSFTREVRHVEPDLTINLIPRNRRAEENVRAFLATNDLAFLNRSDIPYPGADSLKIRLDQPAIRDLMPVSMRRPLVLTAAESKGFVAIDSRAAPYTPPPAPRSGAAPGTPPLSVYQVVGSFTDAGAAATGTWRSQPMTATPGSWLKFETAGALAGDGDSGVSLSLNDAQTGKLLAQVHPKRAPGTSWHAAYVKAPDKPFTVNAVDTSPEQWLAFSAPTEMTALSHLAWQLAKAGHLIAIGAALAGLVLGLCALVLEKPRTP